MRYALGIRTERPKKKKDKHNNKKNWTLSWAPEDVLTTIMLQRGFSTAVSAEKGFTRESFMKSTWRSVADHV